MSLVELTQAEKVAKGINVTGKFEHPGESQTLQIREIFATLQGEGPYSGLPAVFIRLTTCCYGCVWCDSTWDEEKDPRLTPRDAAEQAMSKWDQCIGNTVRPLFVITGGEPLLQDIAPLILALHEMSPFARVQIETAGPFFRDICAADYVTVIVSPKTNVVHPEIAKVARAYKYIIRATDKFHPETGTPLTSTQSLAEKTAVLAWPPSRILPEDVILQPCDEGDPVKNAANRHKCYELAMKHGYRAGLQLHKEFSLP